MTLALLAPLLALASALAGQAAPRAGDRARIAVFALLGLSGLAAIAAGAGALAADGAVLAQLPLGLPWLNWHLRLDGLSGFFLGLIGAVLVPVSLYGPGYTREFAHGAPHPASLHLFTGLFVAGMQRIAWASVAFGLALAGCGTKAGLIPLHAWLPEAHPAAPSHVSALMSGVMLKVAVYGFVRFAFDLLPEPHWTFGVAAALVGSVSALVGALFALVETDLKRVLAWSSVENVGIVFLGLGFALLFAASGAPTLAALGLVAALFHCLNHALFKALLFLGTGAILHASHERDMEHMGGLIHRMPVTAVCFLVGCISISALPPFNGFASEWLLFQTVLQVSFIDSGALRATLPFAAAMLALTGALAAACFVKVFGIVFLGVPRSRHVRHAREVDRGMRAGQAALAVTCLLLGVLPFVVVDALAPVATALTRGAIDHATGGGWLWLTPISPHVASYSAPLVLLGIALAGAAISFARHRQRRAHPVRRQPPWDCGFGGLNPRMQYTGAAFAMPLRRIFAPLRHLDESVERTAPTPTASGRRRSVTRCACGTAPGT